MEEEIAKPEEQVEENQATEEGQRNPKKIRHRKKQLFNTIRAQIEFYFSDSNLSKDRFLSDKVKENNGGKF